MQFVFDTSDVLRKADILQGASARLLALLEQKGVERGADATRFIQRKFRTGAPYTTETRTARRSGGLYDAYDSKVERTDDGGRRGIDLHVGLIKPGEDGQVLVRGRVHEGFDANGNPVEQFVITPTHAPYLRFQLPPEKGGGWVTTKGPVVLKPRRSFPEVKERLRPYLVQDVRDCFGRVTVQ